MAVTYRPSAGQVVMVEPLTDDGEVVEPCLSGVVMSGAPTQVTIDLGRPGATLKAGDEVIVSVFSSDAMYRMRGAVQPLRHGRVVLEPIHDVERVQRRRSFRQPMRVGITLVATDESDPDVARIAGRSLDVGVGGLRVSTNRALPKGAQPIAIVSVPEGAPLMLPTRVVTADVSDRGCEYRLAFTQLRSSDADRLAVLMGATVGGNDGG
jgi:hypothetical protein